MHTLPVQIRFNDIDILGHLNNTVYFSIYDLGKALYMKEAGLRPSGRQRPASVIADIHCTYFAPIHFDDTIFVTTRCSHIGEKSYTLEQQLVDDRGDVRSQCTTVMVYFNPDTGKSAVMPDEYRKKIEEYEGGTLREPTVP